MSDVAGDFQVLSDRMKGYERNFTQILDPELPFIVRLDGVKFSTVSRSFRKPFDERMAKAMLRAAGDSMLKFQPRAVYTASDEVSLFFGARQPSIGRAPLEPGAADPCGDHVYSGRILKTTTVIASYFTARFNHYLADEARCESANPESASALRTDERADKALERMTAGETFFDGRAFSMPDDLECLNNLRWRMIDMRRNSVSTLGRAHFSSSQMHCLGVRKVLANLSRIGVSYDDMPAHFRDGALIKKRNVLKEAFNPKTGQIVPCIRTEVVYGPASTLKIAPDEVSTRTLMSTKLDPESSVLFSQFLPFAEARLWSKDSPLHTSSLAENFAQLSIRNSDASDSRTTI